MVDFTPRNNTTALVFGRVYADDRRVERFGDNLLRLFGTRPGLPDVPMLRQFDLVAHKVTMTPSDRTQLIRVEWRPSDGLAKAALFQVVLLGPGARLVDIIRHDTSLKGAEEDGSFRRTIACRDVSEVLFLSASRDAEGSFSLALSRPRQTPVLMATSWNCRSGRFLPMDPRENEWNWMSPDLGVVTDFTQQNAQGGLGKEMIRLAVRNIGPREAVLDRATVSFWWQPWNPASGGDLWTFLGEGRLSGLRSVDDHERDRRAGRESEDGRMMGKQFVQVSAPQSSSGPPYMIRAVLPSSGDARDQPLIVLGSSRPIGLQDRALLEARGINLFPAQQAPPSAQAPRGAANGRRRQG